ncbi:putative GNAT superfamily acetyltransferase [Natronospira proteinivora]|uniref:GNAT superfamily acetyltransferase n=1 Tax=Natronospira proteinivora TaxID=1807133 RepID=A0ABT1G984_9GAMM|nr:GNAT family N-acetyltransferase [Natronospira proteinivora]MCP1727801.1 putative GNAT superfamily acetyltransferase [Natronospira proteinivora]
MMIEVAEPRDFPAILRMNREWEHFLSPLDETRLSWLHEMAAYHRVIRHHDQAVAFLLAFAPNCAYDSSNYRWFDRRYDDFVYIDRVVVSDAVQGQGAGRLLYQDLMDWARAKGWHRVCCEFDLEPPNERSRHFHESFGFEQQAVQSDPNTGKKVGLQQCRLTG